jgi:hypothetical protein
VTTKKSETQETESVTGQETVYGKDELIAAAKAAFNTRPEVVATALQIAKLEKATRTQTEAAIKKFLTKEAK